LAVDPFQSSIKLSESIVAYIMLKNEEDPVEEEVREVSSV
jgi:hypothetical protein